MKVPVIDLEKLAKDITAWGVPTELVYDDDEEAYVINVGETISYGNHKGKPELTLAPGFMYAQDDEVGRILAYPHSLHIHLTDSSPLSSSLYSRIVAQSRVNFHMNNFSELITIAGIFARV